MKKSVFLVILHIFVFSLFTSVYGQSTQHVIIKTKSDHVRKEMSIRNLEKKFWSQNFEKPKTIRIRQLENSENYGFHFQIPKSELKLLEIYSYDQYAYISPDDNLSFEMINDSCAPKNNTMKFTGEKSQNYNYYRDLNIYLCGRKAPYFRTIKDINQYKIKIDEWRKILNDFLCNYKLKYSLSNDFIEVEQTRIDAEYVEYVYSPIVNYIIDRKLIPSTYLSEANKIQFKNTNLLYIYSYALACQHLFYIDIFTNIDLISSNLKNKKSLSNKNKEYLLTALIGYLAYKQKPDYHSQLTQLITSAKKTVKDSEFLESIDESEAFYMYVNNPFPEKILNTTVLKEFESDKEITLKELLFKYKDKPVYIDFWASWCGGCIMDIQDSEEIKKMLKENGVEYIYLSLDDKNDINWKKSAIKENITSEQYLIKDGNKSPLYQFLKFQTIPQYVFLTSEHKINTTQAPRPVPVNKEKIKKIIDSSKSKVIYF